MSSNSLSGTPSPSSPDLPDLFPQRNPSRRSSVFAPMAEGAAAATRRSSESLPLLHEYLSGSASTSPPSGSRHLSRRASADVRPNSAVAGLFSLLSGGASKSHPDLHSLQTDPPLSPRLITAPPLILEDDGSDGDDEASTPLGRASRRASFVRDCSIEGVEDEQKKIMSVRKNLDQIINRLQDVKDLPEFRRLLKSFVAISKDLPPIEMGVYLNQFVATFAFQSKRSLQRNSPRGILELAKQEGKEQRITTRLRIFRARLKPSLACLDYEQIGPDLNEINRLSNELMNSEVRIYSLDLELSSLYDQFQSDEHSLKVQFQDSFEPLKNPEIKNLKLKDLFLIQSHINNQSSTDQLSLAEVLKENDYQDEYLDEGAYIYFTFNISGMPKKFVAELFEDPNGVLKVAILLDEKRESSL